MNQPADELVYGQFHQIIEQLLNLDIYAKIFIKAID